MPAFKTVRLYLGIFLLGCASLFAPIRPASADPSADAVAAIRCAAAVIYAAGPSDSVKVGKRFMIAASVRDPMLSAQAVCSLAHKHLADASITDQEINPVGWTVSHMLAAQIIRYMLSAPGEYV